MDEHRYNDHYNDDPNANYQKQERKKKRHRKPKEDNYNDDNLYDDYNNEPTIRFETAHQPKSPNLVKSEEENFDPSEAPKRRHKSKSKRKEEEYVEEPDPRINPNKYYEETPNSPELSYDNDVVRKPKKERRKKPRDVTDGEQDDPYLNINLRSPDGSHQNYPFEDPSDSIQLEDDSQYQEPNINNSDDQLSNRDETPVDQKPKKKSGGFMKIFASFKKKNKTKKPDNNLNGKQWQSNPEIFNPAFDSQPGTLERPSKKVGGKSSRDLGSTKAHVILLDGMEVEFDADQKMLGKELFDQVCTYLDLIEKDFFGMTYVNSKLQTWFWLEMDKKITKQLTSADDWTFNFQVKFYPPEPVLLQEDITRYLLSLQVRQDVYTGKLPCSWITQALLGSFMVQSELGDYDELEHGDDIEYLREFEFVLNQSDQLLEKIAELHKKHITMAPDKADVKYLETAKRLEQYGVDLHPARDNDDVEIFIGVCYQGVLIYRDRIRIGRFAWPKVLRISYKKNYFYLKIRSDRYDDSVAIVGFKLFNHNLAKRLWKNAVEQHTFFRMKETQNLKHMPRMIPSAASTFNYSGKTLHQYRSMNISRNEPLKFDRSLTKRRTIGSMPAGLERAGMQYSSMHSLNRSHPRDMTLGKTKSIEYLSSKRPGSNLGIGQGSTSSRQTPQQAKYPPYGSYKDDDRHLSFQSGDSLNAADSYTAHNDDQMSLPPMPTIQQPEYAKPYKKKNSKMPYQSDVLSDDGLISQPEPNKPIKKQNHKKPHYTEIPSDEEIKSPPEYGGSLKKQVSKTSRQNEVSPNDGVNIQVDHNKPIKKHSSKSSRPTNNVSDEETNPGPVYSKPLKKHSSKHRRSNDDLSDDGISPQPVYSKPLKKQSSRSHRQNDDLSDDGSPTSPTRGKLNFKVGLNMSLPDPPVETSQSDDPVAKKRSHQKPTSSANAPMQNRPQPPNHFRPPPPPPEPIFQGKSNSSSERSSPMEHHLPPPPPIETIQPVAVKPKPPPIKPKPAVKPKPKVVSKEQPVAKKYSSRYDDESSNDDML